MTMGPMKTSLVLGTAFGALLVTGAASAAITRYPINLSGAQETPPVTTAATGLGELELDDEAKTLKGKIQYGGLSGTPTAAHIHKGACGESGGVVEPLPDPKIDQLDVDVTLTDAEITDLVAGNLYVNIHTDANGSGEIRGQLYVEGSANKCPEPDAGSGNGTPDSGAGSSGNTSSGGGNDASTVRSDAGSSGGAPAEDDGCSTTGTAPGSGLAIAFGVGIAVAAIGRSRRKR